MLTLKKPIVFFDLEGTGVDPYNDRIVQIAAVKYFPDGSQKEYDWIINPKVKIPPGAIEIHGITNEMVKDKPSMGDLAAELSELFLDADLGGYNIKGYDIPMLQTEFGRIGLELDTEQIKIVDSMLIFMRKESRNLAAAYEKYVGGTFENAHNAMADIKASIAVLEGQLNSYQDMKDNPEAIHDFCFPKDPDSFDAEGKLKFIDGELVINFGKNKGRTLKQLAESDAGYLNWILDGNFSSKVKEAIKEVL